MRRIRLFALIELASAPAKAAKTIASATAPRVMPNISTPEYRPAPSWSAPASSSMNPPSMSSTSFPSALTALTPDVVTSSPAAELKFVKFASASASSSFDCSISHASPLNPASHVHANVDAFVPSTSHVPRPLHALVRASSIPGHAADVQLSSGKPNPGAHATQCPAGSHA